MVKWILKKRNMRTLTEMSWLEGATRCGILWECCEHGNDLSGFIKLVEFIMCLRSKQLHKKKSALWN
jgi:hypothetical protein